MASRELRALQQDSEVRRDEVCLASLRSGSQRSPETADADATTAHLQAENADLRQRLVEMERLAGEQATKTQQLLLQRQQESHAKRQRADEAELRARMAETAVKDTARALEDARSELEAGRRDTRLVVLEAKEEVRGRLEWELEQVRLQKDQFCQEKQELQALIEEKVTLMADQSRELSQLKEQLESGSGVGGETSGEQQPPSSGKAGEQEADGRLREPYLHPTSEVPEHQTRPAVRYPTSLPKLSRFSGERPDQDDGPELFICEFERHAQLAGWTGKVKRLQFEVHLTGRALKTYDSLPVESRRNYESAKEAWQGKMQPVRLESYRRSQFNSRRQQQDESVSDFALDLQRLMEKAYARHNLDSELRDKILLGQFEQGLLTTWKRHLKYPLETFEDALQQARLAEAVEDQLIGDGRDTSLGRKSVPDLETEHEASSSDSGGMCDDSLTGSIGMDVDTGLVHELASN